MQSEKSRIEKYLELQLKEFRSITEQFLSPEHRIAFKTELITKGKIINEELPPQKVFKRSQVNKISFTIFGTGGFSAMAILVGFKFDDWVSATLLFFIAIAVWTKVWISDPKNSIKLDHVGITYNEDFFPWKNIISTHILYTDRPSNNGEDESYLILELLTGEIKKLELTKINFSKTYLDDNSSDEVIFGHYIEMYKRNLKSFI